MKYFAPLVLFLVVVLIPGCATPDPKVSFPKGTENFTPKQTYAVQFDDLWSAALSALEKNRISMSSTDKASGIIQTDYLEGQAARYVGGLVSSSTRYKFNLTVRKVDEQNTRLTILAKIEATVQGTSGASPWTDVSGRNGPLVSRLEHWLYEEVEKQLPAGK